jgi:hypothetical protein
METNTQDAAIIQALGGPSRVAELIGLKKHGGAQRVQNWLVRGIPSRVKVKYPHHFMPELMQARAKAAQPATKATAKQAV